MIHRADEAERATVAGGNPRRDIPPGRLQHILDAHQLWVRTRGREGKRAELFDADLGRANLRLAVLVEANLQGAELDRAVLEGARLQRADLQRASLRGADLQRASMHQANCQGADLFEAHLEEAELYEANLQVVNFLAANLQHADLQRANLQRAFLKETRLQGANLQGANLQGANLQGAYGVDAAMQRVNLREANLSGADLRLADLQGAELQGSVVQDTQFQHANLRDADLTATTGLIASQLAGADLAGARLPETITAFSRLTAIRERTIHSRRLALLMLLGCAVSWFILGTTTDVMLLTNAPLRLFPDVNLPLSSVGFVRGMPVLLLSLFLYLHVHLQRLWEDIATLPAVFPDGSPVDKVLYPWLVHGLVRTYNTRLQSQRLPLTRLQGSLSVLLLWWLVPLTLLLFWARALVQQAWITSLVHIALLVAVMGFTMLFYNLARQTLRGRAIRRYKYGAMALLVAFVCHVVFSAITFGALTGVPAPLLATPASDLRSAPGWSHNDIGRVVPYVMRFLAVRPFANLVEAEVSTKLAPWASQEDDPRPLVQGAMLRGRNLRYVEARGAFLVNADLREANLQGADLRHADLRGAQLAAADMRGARLQGADLRYATGLSTAQLAEALTDGTTRLPDMSGVASPAPR